jgi:hypothetical protein
MGRLAAGDTQPPGAGASTVRTWPLEAARERVSAVRARIRGLDGDTLHAPPERLQCEECRWNLTPRDGARGYADGDTFALPIVARVIAATAT